MAKLLITSCLDIYSKDESGTRIPHNFGNKNGVFDNISKFVDKYDNFVFVASDPDNHIATDIYAGVTIESFKLTLPFKNYTILDGRNKSQAKEIIESADFIFLCGGHVPTQNKFFNEIRLREIIHNTKALICGGSAGSMNMADVVYAQPELEGESIDNNYRRYLPGLGLTNISILPHFNERINDTLDGKSILNDISIPDSINRPFIAISDGDYILVTDDEVIMYGESYLFNGGSYSKLTEQGSVTNITELVNNLYSPNLLD